MQNNRRILQCLSHNSGFTHLWSAKISNRRCSHSHLYWRKTALRCTYIPFEWRLLPLFACLQGKQSGMARHSSYWRVVLSLHFPRNMMPSSNELIFTSIYISSYPEYLCISLNKVGMQCWVTYLDNLCSSKSKTLQLYLPLSVKFCCLFLALQQRQQSLWQIIQVMRCKLWQGSFILLYY